MSCEEDEREEAQEKKKSFVRRHERRTVARLGAGSSVVIGRY